MPPKRIASEDELQQLLQKTFEQLAASNGLAHTLGAPSPSAAAAESHERPPRANVFRVRKTTNGHRLPPLPEHSFEKKWEKKHPKPQTATDSSSHLRRTTTEDDPTRVRAGGNRRAVLAPIGRDDVGGDRKSTTTRRPSLEEASRATGDAHSLHRHQHSVGDEATEEGPSTHQKICAVCAAETQQRQQRAFERMVKAERNFRTAIIVEEMGEFDEGVMQAWDELVTARHNDRRQKQHQDEEQRLQQRVEQAIESALWKELRLIRRSVVADWEVGFDEIAAVQRLCLRHLTQVNEVMEKNRLKRQQEKNLDQLMVAQRALRDQVTRTQKAQDAVSDEETRERAHHERCEAAVRQATFQVFFDARLKIQEQATQVQSMLQRHAQKLQTIESEKEKLKQEEFARRDLTVTTEKRAHEMILQMEPDSRRKAGVATNARIKREHHERQTVEDQFMNALDEERKAEEQGYQQLVRSAEEGLLDATKKQRRREKREEHKRLQTRCAEREAIHLKREDDDAWHLLRYRFAKSLHYAAMDQEANERRVLLEKRNEERDFIWNLLRVRLFLGKNEERARADILAAHRAENAAVEEELKRSKSWTTLLWFESKERRQLSDECSREYTLFEEYRGKLLEAQTCLMKAPAASTDRCTTGPPGCEYALWVRNSVVQWFSFSNPVVLLEGSSLRSASTTSTMLSDIRPGAAPVTVTLLNPAPDDVLLYVEPGNNSSESLPLSHKSTLTVQYSGPVVPFFSAFSFQNKSKTLTTKLYPRIVSVNFCGIAFTMVIVVLPPLVALPDMFVSSRVAMPIQNLRIPHANDYKNCRVVLAMQEADIALGNKLQFQPSTSEVMWNPKTGISMGSKALAKTKLVTDRVMEFEFDPKLGGANGSTAAMRALLQSFVAVHADDSVDFLPMQLDVFLTKKTDSSTLRVSQSLDIDRVLGNAPRFRSGSSDLYFRLPFSGESMPKDSDLAAIVPSNAQHLFAYCRICFPPLQPDVMGGGLTLTLRNDDGMTVLEMRAYTNGLPLLVDADGVLWVRREDGMPGVSAGCTAKMTQELNQVHATPSATVKNLVESNKLSAVGKVKGWGSPRLEVVFDGVAALSGHIVNEILRSITLRSTRTSAPKKDVVMALQVEADVAYNSPPIHTEFRVVLQQGTLEAKSSGFAFREGAGPKSFPSITVKPNISLSAEAILEVKLVEGAEADDHIALTDCEVRGQGLVHVQAGQSIAVLERVSSSHIVLRLCGQFGSSGSPPAWLRESIEDPYARESSSFANLSRYDVTPNQINILLRSLRYNSECQGQEKPVKRAVVTFDDGRTGRTTVPLEITVETVDDPTDIILDEEPVEYRQNSSRAALGVALMPTVRLEDIDSDNFHGGYITIEHCTMPTGEPGDHLYMLSPEKQEALLFRPNGKSSRTALQHLLSWQSDAEVQERLPVFAIIVDEQPNPLLTLREDRYMMYCGENIGTVSVKQTNSKETYFLKMNFFAESKFVSFPAAEYCMRCVGYDNKSSKMVSGERSYTITLNCTGLASTCDTVEKVTVRGFVALVSNPSFAAVIKYEEGLKPKPILKQACSALHQPLFQKGFLRATVVNAFEGDEIQLDQSGDIKLKDGRAVILGKELIANIPARKSNHTIHIDFLKMPNAALQSLIRSLVFGGSQRGMDPTQRVIEVDCSTGGDGGTDNMCSLTVLVDIARRDEPVEFAPYPGAGPLLHMSGQPPSPLCSTIRLAVRQGKLIPQGTELELSLMAKPKLGESLGVRATGEVDLLEDPTEKRRLQFMFGERLLATAPKSKSLEDNVFFFGKTVLVQLHCDVPASEMNALLDTIVVVNTSKSDRGSKKNIQVTLRQKQVVVAKHMLLLEVVAPILDFSLSPPILHGSSAMVAAAARLQLSNSVSTIEISVVVAAGYDFSDVLSLKFPPNDPYGLVLDDDTIYITSPASIQQYSAIMAAAANNSFSAGGGDGASPLSSSPLKRHRSMGSISPERLASPAVYPGAAPRSQWIYLCYVNASNTSIVVTAEGVLPNGPLQSVLRAMCLTGEPRGDKDVLVEVSVSSTCGTCRELVRVIM